MQKLFWLRATTGFVGSTQAGIVLTPCPEPATIEQEPTTDGDMSAGATADGIIQNEAAATFMQVVLNLLALA